MLKPFRKHNYSLSWNGSNLQQPDWLAMNQSDRTIFDPTNELGWYKNLLQTKTYGTVQSLIQPSDIYWYSNWRES